MTGRVPWDPQAGPWVAFVESPHPRARPDGPTTLRAYPWPHGDPADWQGWSWTSVLEDAIRYDSKAEALAAVAGPRRRGVRRVAHLIDNPPPR